MGGGGTQAADDGAMPFIIVGAVAGGALLVGGALWAMKQTTLGLLTGGRPGAAGNAAIQQSGNNGTAAVGGASGLNSLGVQPPAGSSRV